MVRMARARLKRKREGGKDSIFHVNNKQVPDRNINRYLKRNKISEESLLSMASPIDGTIVLYTDAEDTNPLKQRLLLPFVSPHLVLDHRVSYLREAKLMWQTSSRIRLALPTYILAHHFSILSREAFKTVQTAPKCFSGTSETRFVLCCRLRGAKITCGRVWCCHWCTSLEASVLQSLL